MILDRYDTRHHAREIREALSTAYTLRVHVEDLLVQRGYQDAGLREMTVICAQLEERTRCAERALHELASRRAEL